MPDKPQAASPPAGLTPAVKSPVVASQAWADTRLLKTKLYRPALPRRRIRRPQLLQRLDEGLAAGRQIVLVSAPAGFGKTTCILEWVAALGWPCAWLSLEPADNDPGRFFTYFIAALQQVEQALGREIEGVLQAGQLPPGDSLSTALINDILSISQPFVLALDDLQVIQDALILQVLERLVMHLPPPLHLVLLTREDPSLPLAQLRADNQLTELRAGDLRFTPGEAEQFMNGPLGLALSPAEVAALEDKTEGWIVGLQLAGLALQSPAARPASAVGQNLPASPNLIAGLQGSQRYVLSYLTEEVLNRQPEDIQRFLLQTSILDKLCGDLCQAVTGRADATLTLERLFNANLFLVSLDEEQRWYRFHRLFADLLRNRQSRLYQDQTAELHRRASHWYAEAGLANEAIQHALAAADYPLAVSWLEQHATEMLLQGYIKTVEGWLSAIPPELRAQSVRTNLALAWMYLMRGDMAQAAPFVERLRALPPALRPAEGDPALKAEWLALQAYVLIGQAQFAEGINLAKQALEIAPETDNYVRTVAYNALGTAYLQLDAYDEAVEVYRQAMVHSRMGTNIVAEMLCTSILAQIALQHGQLQLVLEVTTQSVERLERTPQRPPISAIVYGALGLALYYRHHLEPARGHILRALQLCSLGGFADGEIYLRAVWSRWLQLAGDLEAADQELEKAVTLTRAETSLWVREEVCYQQVRLDVARGRLARAERAFRAQCLLSLGQFPLPELTPDAGVNYSKGLLYVSALRLAAGRLQTDRDKEDSSSAITTATSLIQGAQQSQHLLAALEALLLRSQLQAMLGNRAESLADCAQALELAEPEEHISLFIEAGLRVAEGLAALPEQGRLSSERSDYVKRILSVSPVSSKPDDAELRGIGDAAESELNDGVQPGLLVEPLSKRELEILGLICEGCSNQEIAERLVLSLHTVKKHGSNIFAKLQVSSRTQAVARARQLRLVRP